MLLDDISEQLAEQVVIAIKAALSPVIARVAAVESRPLVSGRDGSIGPVGEKGLQGDQGPRGEQGEPGAVGPQGNPGDRGPNGDPGERGESGAVGPQGEKGDPGEPGQIGLRGEKGMDGKDFTRDVDDLDQADLMTHADVLMRKAFADLDAAAPRRIDRVPIRERGTGRVLRVVEVEQPKG